MTDTSKAQPKVNTAIPQAHDRVAVLSVRADGSHDQLNPELLDPEAAREYTKRQFAEQAVGVADYVPPAKAEDDGPQDASIAARKAEHDKIVEAAEKAADAVIDGLAKK